LRAVRHGARGAGRPISGTVWAVTRGRKRRLVAWSILAALVVRVASHRSRRREVARQIAAGEPPGRHISWLGRALDPFPGSADQPFVMPSLPPAEVVSIPDRGEFVVRRGGRSSGVPVLLMHGWMATADLNWFLLYEALGTHHPIVAPDLRGHGRAPRSSGAFTLESCADDAAAILRRLGIERAIVVGYSLGGPVSMLLWRRHSDLVAGLVLEATAMEWSGTRRERLAWRTLGLIGFLLRWPTGRIVLLRAMGGVRDLPTGLLPYRAWADGEFRRNDPMEVAEAGRALAAFDARPFAPSIDVPTAVVVTTRDSLVPPKRQRALAAALRASVFELDGDHTAVAVQPDELAEVTLQAIRAVTGEPASAPVEAPPPAAESVT
jgi:3-oxoadipate enol-lactonase